VIDFREKPPPPAAIWQTIRGEAEKMNIDITGIGGLVLLIADIWAIVSVVQSSASTGKKVLWIVLILILPLLGLILWFFLGPRGSRL
jgi:hypothetical protein